MIQLHVIMRSASRTPPFFLVSANDLAPKSTRRTEIGVLPSRIIFNKSVMSSITVDAHM